MVCPGVVKFPLYHFRHFTFARIDMSFARILFYECAEKLLSFARFNCAFFYYFYRLPGHPTGNVHMVVISGFG